jgi:GMP synthase-like glutamine amidotransferase
VSGAALPRSKHSGATTEVARRLVRSGAVRGLVVGNGNDFDPGFVGQSLREHGYAFTEGHRERPDEWPPLAGIDMVLLLGSEWHVYDPATAELVESEAQLVRHAIVAGVPVLGICFGGQVIAHALGGQVTRTDRYEIGWYDVEPLAGAPGDFVAGPWLEWHDDVFSVPEGFDVLARTASGPQLVRRDRVVGTQFHPECTETMLASWLRMGGADQYRQRGGDPAAFLAATREKTEVSRLHAASLVDWFVDHVAPS